MEQPRHSSYLFLQQWCIHQRKVVIHFLYLHDILLLHLTASYTHPTLYLVLTVLRVQHLIYHNILDINPVFAEFLDESFCFVEGQELGNADSNEGSASLGGCYSVLDLSIHCCDDVFHYFYATEGRVVHTFTLWLTHHCRHLSK